MNKSYCIIGIVIGVHFITGCEEASKTSDRQNQKNIELRIADIVIVDDATGKPLMTTDGYEIFPSEKITYPHIIEMPNLSDDSESLRLRMTWIADLEDTNTLTIKADGYETKTLSLDQVSRIKGSKISSKCPTMELRLKPKAEKAAP